MRNPLAHALVACDGEYVLLVHQHETRSGGVTPCKFARHPSGVQACESASGHLKPDLGDRISRRTASTALSHCTLCSDARRATRVCAAHRRSRGPGDFLIGKALQLPPVGSGSPGSRAALSPRCGSFTIHNSQFTWQTHRTSTGGTRAPARGARARAVGSAGRAACGIPQGHLPPRDRPPARRRRRPRGRSRGSGGSRRRGRHPRYLWGTGAVVSMCMHAGAEACVRVDKEASEVPKAQTQMTSLPQTLHAFH